MKKIITLFLVALPFFVNAQEKTYGGKEEGLVKMHSGLGSLVIIPFSNRMYLSDADNPIGRETGLNPGELQVKFKNALLESLEQELVKDWDIKVMYEQVNREQGFDLDFVHASCKYNYIPVSGEVLMANDTTITKKDLRESKSKKGGSSGIHGGEVVTNSDDREKFMDLEVDNDTLLQYLDRNMHSDYYLFINEMDIRHYIDDPDRISSGGLSYQLKVHFSCLDKKGMPLVSGLATSKVKVGNSNIYEVIKAGIPEITQKIAKMIRSFNEKKNQ
jgi:hypothetical protein